MKISLADEVQALLLLSSLPDSWETLVVSLSNSVLEGNLTTTTAKDSLLNEEARRKEFNPPVLWRFMLLKRLVEEVKVEGRRSATIPGGDQSP